MNETTYAYIVHSDINENNIYSEFEKEEDAIAYARKHKDELTYVDKVEVALDEDGEIIEMFDSETIWVYDWEIGESNETDALPVESDDELPDMDTLVADIAGAEDDEDDLYESLVEDLEENEDMVECKECFDLFPKVDGVKLTFGYLCPHCRKALETPETETMSDHDFFTVDFPEVGTPAVATVEPECVGPGCEVPVEAPVTKEETVDALIKDEQEAFDIL